MTTLFTDGVEGRALAVTDRVIDRLVIRGEVQRLAVTGVSSGQRGVTVALHGELDATTAAILYGQLAFFYVDDPWVMVADMSDVTLIDVDGMTAIVDARQALRLRCCNLSIRDPSATVRLTLERSGLTGLVEL